MAAARDRWQAAELFEQQKQTSVLKTYSPQLALVHQYVIVSSRSSGLCATWHKLGVRLNKDPRITNKYSLLKNRLFPVAKRVAESSPVPELTLNKFDVLKETQ